MRFAYWIFIIYSIAQGGCGASKPQTPDPIPPVQASRPEKSCDGFHTKMDEVWNDAVLERLNLTVRIYKGELTAADGERIVSELKEVSKRWVSRSAEACQEYNRNTDISTADYDRQETCFDSALNMLKKRLIRFSDGDNTALDDISTITDKCL